MTSPHSIRDVVAQMIAVVPEDALSDLQDEDPASAVEVHFEPVCVHQLPRASIRGEDCSVDGYYEVFIDPDRPRSSTRTMWSPSEPDSRSSTNSVTTSSNTTGSVAA